tara:strand:- start:265 stop:396 length:132 start_codon:yes stop_codon:yes gene_type:complete
MKIFCNKCKKEFEIEDEELSNYDSKYDNKEECWSCNDEYRNQQ